MKKLVVLSLVISVIVALTQCQPDKPVTCTDCNGEEPVLYEQTPYPFEIPVGFPQPFIPADNPMTVEGVALGRYLFYDKNLSRDRSLSCASCHFQGNMFGDPDPVSTGIDGQQGRRQAMVLFNLAWQEKFFWDGRAGSLEEQVVMPVTDPIELDSDWETVISRVSTEPTYDSLFIKAFNQEEVTQELIAKAMAQFIRTMVSANSKYDRVIRLGQESWDAQPAAPDGRSLQEIGYNMFLTEEGDCFHCHGEQETSFLLGGFAPDLTFLNNGSVTDNSTDLGREEVTNATSDFGKFKVPSLRNVSISAPYFHNGSIPDLDSLLNFYSMGGHTNKNIDPNMRKQGVTFPRFNELQKDALEQFIFALSDFDFLQDTAYSNPWPAQ